MYRKWKVKVIQSCPTLFGPHGLYVALQAPLSMKFSRPNTGVGCHAFIQ